METIDSVDKDKRVTYGHSVLGDVNKITMPY
jgi:hypothetical protein